MIEAVFDTNTFLQAATSVDGPSHRCWKFAEEQLVRIFVTEAIFAELEDVLTRPKVRRQFPQLTDQNVANMLTTFRTFCELVPEPEAVFQLSRDHDDAKFIDLAVSTGAPYLVTRDRDLLDLRDDSEFSSHFPGINIVTPVGFLEAVRTA